MSQTQPLSRYSAVAIILHWLLAVLLIGMVFGGWYMGDAFEEAWNAQPRNMAALGEVYPLFQIHKSLGFTILALSLIRLVWRLTHRPPPLPASVKPWERRVASATHFAFYVLMIGIPLMGWAYVSAGYSVATQNFFSVATSWFGFFEIPHLPFIASQDEEARKQIAENAMFAHGRMAWVVLILAALHIGAALKHQFIDRDDVLARMAPLFRQKA
jgi:cytochrome b561